MILKCFKRSPLRDDRANARRGDCQTRVQIIQCVKTCRKRVTGGKQRPGFSWHGASVACCFFPGSASAIVLLRPLRRLRRSFASVLRVACACSSWKTRIHRRFRLRRVGCGAACCVLRPERARPSPLLTQRPQKMRQQRDTQWRRSPGTTSSNCPHRIEHWLWEESPCTTPLPWFRRACNGSASASACDDTDHRAR